MKGGVVDVYTVYESQTKRLVIPVYQRNYDWSVTQCARLFDDLEEMIAEDRPKHFFGAVVGNPVTSFHWDVIDGQQRLTTVSLLMLAFSRALDAGEITASEEGVTGESIRITYLESALSPDAGKKFKLKPIKGDDEAYTKLFGDEEDFITESNVTANYLYFRDRIRQTELKGDELWRAICNLEVMHLDLEPHDDPQRIFESLNSTGLALAEADKIRNFILMSMPPKEQEDLYHNRWNPIEKNVSFRTDWFIRWYLVTKTTRTPRKDQVYEAFKSHIENKRGEKRNVVEVMDDMFAYSKTLRSIEACDTGMKSVDSRLRRFRPIMGDVILPFLLPLLRDAYEGKVSENEVLNVIKILETYILRRLVSGVATNSLNKTFATLYSDVSKLLKEDVSIVDVVTYQLLRKSGTSGRMPDDAEFKESFETRNFWNMHKDNREYIFDYLENGESKDIRDISGALNSNAITIEHIMPRTLTAAWKTELGADFEEIHSTWINRIGNLTITGYNSRYSNRSFQDKKTIEHGFDSSPYRLNDFVKKNDKWGLDQLRERNAQLTQRAMELWPMPTTDFAPPAAVLNAVPMGDEEPFTGEVITAFEFDGVRETVTTWADMMPALVKHLLENHRARVYEFAKGNDQPGLFIWESEELKSGSRKIEPGLAVWVANSTSMKMYTLRMPILAKWNCVSG